jgi:hypothetical protein
MTDVNQCADDSTIPVGSNNIDARELRVYAQLLELQSHYMAQVELYREAVADHYDTATSVSPDCFVDGSRHAIDGLLRRPSYSEAGISADGGLNLA